MAQQLWRTDRWPARLLLSYTGLALSDGKLAVSCPTHRRGCQSAYGRCLRRGQWRQALAGYGLNRSYGWRTGHRGGPLIINEAKEELLEHANAAEMTSNSATQLSPMTSPTGCRQMVERINAHASTAGCLGSGVERGALCRAAGLDSDGGQLALALARKRAANLWNEALPHALDDTQHIVRTTCRRSVIVGDTAYVVGSTQPAGRRQCAV